MRQALADNCEPGTTVDPAAILRRTIPGDAREQMWSAADGHAIRRIDWPGHTPAGQTPRGSLLFVPGRADFYEKYIETLDAWARQGWRVTALDWRWQAGSGRFGPDHRIGGVDDFVTWINDLTWFWETWALACPHPHVLIGHSMGGHLALRAVAQRRVRPDALVLSAPMLGFNTAIPLWLQPLFAWTMCRLGNPERAAWADGERPGDTASTRGGTLTHDRDRYADEGWWRQQRRELDLGPASWNWVRKAGESMAVIAQGSLLESVEIPVQVLMARADALVSGAAIARAAARLPYGEVVEFGSEAAHELLREADPVRDRVLAAVERFLTCVPARAAPGL